MSESNNVKNLLGVSIDKIKEVVDIDTVIGNPITSGSATIIPVSKVSYGFASGGSDLPSKQSGGLFGGGAGAGVNITPIAFLVIENGNVRLLPITAKQDAFDKAMGLVPSLVDKVTNLISGKKDGERASEAKNDVEDMLED